jgi:HlyD family secretion protein
MDIARPERAQQLRRKRILWGGAGAGVLALATVALARLEPAPPTVEQSTLWIDTVHRGEMVREVRGQGTLVPEREQWVTADHDAQVLQVLHRAGESVTPDTVILQLGNPELAQQVQQANADVATAEADVRELEARLESELLNQEAASANLAAQAAEARMQVEANKRLFDEQLLPKITLDLSKLHADELAKRQQLDEQRLQHLRDANAAQIAGRRARLEQMRTMQRLRDDQLAALGVRAGIRGILQDVPVEPGQRVQPGVVLAKVAQPETLKAALRIPETQAKDVTVGQSAQIDTRNGIVEGRVARIDPAARQGTVLVDVRLTGALPQGARPDLSVDGTIELEHLRDVLYVGRPALGQPGDKVGLFRLAKDGDTAQRVTVELGRASTHTIEIVRGLQEGDRVILSDTSAWDTASKIRLR